MTATGDPGASLCRGKLLLRCWAFANDCTNGDTADIKFVKFNAKIAKSLFNFIFNGLLSLLNPSNERCHDMKNYSDFHIVFTRLLVLRH